MHAITTQVCALGEGPLWHPGQQALFWFDILGRRLYRQEGDALRHWQFDECVSAAGWVDDSSLLMASETGLYLFDSTTGARERICDLEADRPATRSNDGRADPWGGFWIGTMGKGAEPGMGAIYRYYRGELRRLFAPITVSNAICFAPDRRHAYFADTEEQKIRRVALAAEDGWPEGEASVWLDLGPEGLFPDGAVVDVDGCLWNAQWGAGRVARYDPEGRFMQAIAVPASKTTCPAFGGADLGTLFCTSAAEGLDGPPAGAGLTYATQVAATGQVEHRVIL